MDDMSSVLLHLDHLDSLAGAISAQSHLGTTFALEAAIFYSEQAALEGVAGTLGAVAAFVATVWGAVRAIKNLIFGKAQEEDKRLAGAQAKFENIPDDQLEAALDQPIPPGLQIPAQKSVAVETAKTLSHEMYSNLIFGMIPFTPTMFRNNLENAKKAAGMMTTPLQEVYVDAKTGASKVVNKFKEVPSVKTLREGGWTKQNIGAVLKDARKAAAPSRWGGYLRKIFSIIPTLFKAVTKKDPTAVATVAKNPISKVIVGFFKGWMHLFKTFVWGCTLGKIMFVGFTLASVVGVISRTRRENRANQNLQKAQLHQSQRAAEANAPAATAG